jgi:hypothetical protein
MAKFAHASHGNQGEIIMYTLAPDEKVTTVLVYSPNKLIHGDLVTKKDARVGIWLRMQDLPNYLHLLNTEVLFFGGTPHKSLKYDEYYFPISRIIAFHLAPGSSEPLDYDPETPNRAMVDVDMIIGAFMLKGSVRMSTHADFTRMIEISHTTWFSVYDADINNPFLPEMPTIHVPMVLVNPTQVSFGM